MDVTCGVGAGNTCLLFWSGSKARLDFGSHSCDSSSCNFPPERGSLKQTKGKLVRCISVIFPASSCALQES